MVTRQGCVRSVSVSLGMAPGVLGYSLAGDSQVVPATTITKGSGTMAATLVLSDDRVREQAKDWVRRAPDGSKLTFMRPEEKAKTRPQENKFHAMVRDVAGQVQHAGKSYDESEWKKLFCDALRRETNIVPSLDGSGFVDLGWASTSRLTTQQYTDLIMIVQAYGDQHGVRFRSDAGLDLNRPLGR